MPSHNYVGHNLLLLSAIAEAGFLRKVLVLFLRENFKMMATAAEPPTKVGRARSVAQVIGYQAASITRDRYPSYLCKMQRKLFGSFFGLKISKLF